MRLNIIPVEAVHCVKGRFPDGESAYFLVKRYEDRDGNSNDNFKLICSYFPIDQEDKPRDEISRNQDSSGDLFNGMNGVVDYIFKYLFQFLTEESTLELKLQIDHQLSKYLDVGNIVRCNRDEKRKMLNGKSYGNITSHLDCGDEGSNVGVVCSSLSREEKEKLASRIAEKLDPKYGTLDLGPNRFTFASERHWIPTIRKKEKAL